MLKLLEDLEDPKVHMFAVPLSPREAQIVEYLANVRDGSLSH